MRIDLAVEAGAKHVQVVIAEPAGPGLKSASALDSFAFTAATARSSIARALCADLC